MKKKNIKISALILICLLLIFVILKKDLIKRNLYYLSDSYPEIYNKFLHLILDNDIVFSDNEINNLFNSLEKVDYIDIDPLYYIPFMMWIIAILIFNMFLEKEPSNLFMQDIQNV